MIGRHKDEMVLRASAWISVHVQKEWLLSASPRHRICGTAMRIAKPGRLMDRLVGPKASVAQIALILVPALLAGLLCGQLLKQQDAQKWAVILVALLAFDLVGGCVACSLPPLQRLHRIRYRDPLKQAGFQLGHAGHAIAIAWLLFDPPAGAAALGISLLLLGAVGGAMCSRSVAGGFGVALALAWPAYAIDLPGSSPIFVLLSMALAFKLFVAFPSFERRAKFQEAA